MVRASNVCGTNKTQKAFRKGFFLVYKQDFQNIPEIPILNAKNHF